METPDPAPRGATEPRPRYRIEVGGHLAPTRLEELGCIEQRASASGRTVLTAELADQAALHGALARLRDLGIPLLALQRLPDEPATPLGDPIP